MASKALTLSCLVSPPHRLASSHRLTDSPLRRLLPTAFCSLPSAFILCLSSTLQYFLSLSPSSPFSVSVLRLLSAFCLPTSARCFLLFP